MFYCVEKLNLNLLIICLAFRALAIILFSFRIYFAEVNTLN